MNRRWRVGAAVWTILLCLGHHARADDVRPAYLGIEVTQSGQLAVTWKNPLLNGEPLRIAPVFPDGFQRISAITVVKTSDAILNKWTLSAAEGALDGAIVKIDGLPATASEVLFRVKFADGRVYRGVIKPNAPEAVVPAANAVTEADEAAWYRGLRWVDSKRLVILLLIVGAFGAFPAARRRGVLVCALALILGSGAGYVAGQASANGLSVGGSVPDEEEAGRIVHGLLLNVYRSFGYGEDEAVYDQMSKSVVGELLTDVYLQNRNAMRIEEEDKAYAFVDRVDIRRVADLSKEDGGVSLTVEWDVYGSVSHWEHIHYRCNAYHANLTLIRDGKYWKIKFFDLLDEKRVM